MCVKIFLKIGIISILIGLISCNGSSSNSSSEVESKAESQIDTTVEKVAYEYTCPMRCEGGESNDPGTCSVCKMLLVRSVEMADFGKEKKAHTLSSIYELESNWINQKGEPVQLENVSDNYQLVCMMFTKCPHACPNLIGDMQKIDQALDDETRDKLDYLLVSIDPEYDTPEQLAAYAESYELNANKWTLLHGEEQDVRDLSQLLGVEYKTYENGMIGHTNYLTLLNKRGEIIYRLRGLNMPNEDMVAFMKEHI